MRRLLWFDACAGASAGILMLALRGWLTPWYRFPPRQLLMMGLVNLAYAAFGLYLVTRPQPPLALVRVLFTANFAWASACAMMAVLLFDTASSFGLAQLVLEALFVGVLAEVERRRWRALMPAS